MKLLWFYSRIKCKDNLFRPNQTLLLPASLAKVAKPVLGSLACKLVPPTDRTLCSSQAC